MEEDQLCEDILEMMSGYGKKTSKTQQLDQSREEVSKQVEKVFFFNA